MSTQSPYNGRGVDVLGSVLPDGRIRLEWSDGVVRRRHRDPELVRAALRRTGGFARWSEQGAVLSVPVEPGVDRLFPLRNP